MRTLVAPFFLLLSLTVAQAQGSALCNPHGAAVTMDDGTVLYLGNDCDAAQKGGGTGKWYYSASFIAVVIDGRSMRINWDIECDLPYCQSDGAPVRG